MTKIGPFRRLLVVVKASMYQVYRETGEVLSDTRWDRLLKRHNAHEEAVEELASFLKSRGLKSEFVPRADVQARHTEAADLVVSIGGDGTALAASHKIMTSTTPLIGINSDPTSLSFRDNSMTPWDERRSTGALCSSTRDTMIGVLGEVIAGDRKPVKVARIRTSVNGLVLPPALNDVLLAHPSPAAVSRYSINISGKISWDGPGQGGEGNRRYFHVRSSGMRACSLMEEDSTDLQYMDREPIYFNRRPEGERQGHGFVARHEAMDIRWNSAKGMAYVDGSHITHDLAAGDNIEISTGAPPCYSSKGTATSRASRGYVQLLRGQEERRGQGGGAGGGQEMR